MYDRMCGRAGITGEAVGGQAEGGVVGGDDGQEVAYSIGRRGVDHARFRAHAAARAQGGRCERGNKRL